MVEITDVRKSFADLIAINNVSLSVNKGSIYGLVGSNGAGKTTLLKLITGLYRQDEGDILIQSAPVFENIEIKEKILFIPDQLYYFSNFTIQDMANFYRQIYPDWDQERYLKLEEVFAIDVKHRIRTLSKGMQRQVAFWLGFALMPELMVLDEPLDGLDPVMRQKVKKLIVQDVAERQMTVIVSSHNLRELEDICDHIGILHAGKMIIQRDLDDLKADVHKIQVAFAGTVPDSIYDDVRALYQEKRGSVCIFIIRGKYEDIIEQMYAYQPAVLDVLPLTLEEIFIYEMGDNGYEIQNIIY